MVLCLVLSMISCTRQNKVENNQLPQESKIEIDSDEKQDMIDTSSTQEQNNNQIPVDNNENNESNSDENQDETDRKQEDPPIIVLPRDAF